MYIVVNMYIGLQRMYFFFYCLHISHMIKKKQTPKSVLLLCDFEVHVIEKVLNKLTFRSWTGGDLKQYNLYINQIKILKAFHLKAFWI